MILFNLCLLILCFLGLFFYGRMLYCLLNKNFTKGLANINRGNIFFVLLTFIGYFLFGWSQIYIFYFSAALLIGLILIAQAKQLDMN